jgi:ABC-type polar amino acid transport system ATPase subunit
VRPVDRPVIECVDVHLSRGPREVLRGVSFEMRRGEVVALMGASGSGKTTILRAIAGLDPIDRGEIEVGGVRVSAGPGVDGRQLRAKSAMVFQFHCLFEHLPVLQNVWLAPVHVQRVPRAEAVQRATALLRSLGVEHRAGALPRELSGGEAQRVAIARALAVDAPVLLMDEPTASLDAANVTVLERLVRGLADAGRPVVWVTHDEAQRRRLADYVIHLDGGRVVAAGPDVAA